MYRTDRLTLIPATPALIRADLAGRESLARALGHAVPETWPPELFDHGALEYSLKRLEADPAETGWSFCYLVDDQGAVGIAGYKGPPGPDGTVEIGYSVLAACQRRGYASEAARALVARAFAEQSVARVIAETMPPLVPSIRVLEKNGFRLIGQGSEPGVIRFELTRAEYSAGPGSGSSHRSLFFRLLGHMAWADHRVLEALEAAGSRAPEQLGLLAHVLAAEHVWLARLRLQAPELAVWPSLDLEQCQALARANELGFREFLLGLTDQDLRRGVAYRNSAAQDFSSTVEDILLHVFLHGTYHRGQISRQLRQDGAEPAATDYIAFVRGAPAATRQPAG